MGDALRGCLPLRYSALPSADDHDHDAAAAAAAATDADDEEVRGGLNATVAASNSNRAPRSPTIDWDTVPPSLDPKGGGLKPARCARKRLQLEAMVALVGMLRPKDGDTIVDFCSGSGYVGLLLAARYPRCHVVLLDVNARALAIGARRVADAGLVNVRTACCRVDEWSGPLSIGVALHACGAATDVAQDVCIANGAAYVWTSGRREGGRRERKREREGEMR